MQEIKEKPNTKSINDSWEGTYRLKLVYNEGKITKDVIESRYRLIYDTKLNFSWEIHRSNNCSWKNLNKVAVATGKEF